MSLNWREIDRIIEELDLEGSFVQQVAQPTYQTLSLSIYRPGERFELFVSLHQSNFRFHRDNRHPPKPKKPPRFQEFLKARIVGARIIECRQLGRERIVLFRLLRGGEETRLYLRLWGGALNLIATDVEGIILDAFYRRPKRGEVTGEVFRPEEAVGGHSQAPDPDRFQLRDLPGEGSYQERLAGYYRDLERSVGREEDRRRLRDAYSRDLSGVMALLQRLEGELAGLADGERLKTYGDLITANIYRLSGRESELEVEDPEDGESRIVIPLDPTLTPSENAQAYYRRYKKALSGREALEDQVADARRRRAALQARLDAVEALDEEELDRQLSELEAQGTGAAGAGETRFPGLVFESSGHRIHVGRSWRENDELLRRHVRGNDWWLHTRDYPGAYVFVRTDKGKSVPLDVLLDAGNLALFYSKGKSDGRADLYYTQVKYLRRAKDAKPGTVLPTQEKNLTVELDDDRLERLFSGGR